ncbi:MAG: hypothetical protein U1E26_07660 [Coriobacteriia bacterium]|nr:hypothetical protein [Coriobacteriia bacterium]
MAEPKLSRAQARGALVYSFVGFVVCVWLLRLILVGDWEGVVYTSAGQVVELQFFFVIGAIGAAGAFFSMLDDAFPGIWRSLSRRR